jgi:hypothetical protein
MDVYYYINLHFQFQGPSWIIVPVASTKKVCNDRYKMKLKTNYQKLILLCMRNVLHAVVCEERNMTAIPVYIYLDASWQYANYDDVLKSSPIQTQDCISLEP